MQVMMRIVSFQEHQTPLVQAAQKHPVKDPQAPWTHKEVYRMHKPTA